MKCKHTKPLVLPCPVCGMTRDEQVRVQEASDRITLRARAKVRLRTR